MTGAMFMAHCLKQEGVDRCSAECGHTNYALIHACHKLGIEDASFRHEQQAAHAADAYFRVTHKLAVLNVHLSPGLTNALTGVASAAADSTPMVVFTGNTPLVPPRPRAASGHPPARGRVAGRHLPADLQARVARRRREVPRRRHAARAQPRPGRPSWRAAPLDIPMDVFSQHIEAPAQQMQERRAGFRRAGAPSPTASRRPRRCCAGRRGRRFRRQRRARSRRRATRCGRWPNGWVRRWPRR